MPNLRAVIRSIKKQGARGLRRVGGMLGALAARIPPARRLPVLMGLCVCMALALGVLITVLARGLNRRGESADGLAGIFQPLAIPPEDFFLPGEPDFLPEALLEREPREFWTVEDTRQFWTDPLDYGPEAWGGGIRAAVDELLERVP